MENHTRVLLFGSIAGVLLIGLLLLLFYPGEEDRTVSDQENPTENKRRTETEKPAGEGKAKDKSGKENDKQNRRPEFNPIDIPVIIFILLNPSRYTFFFIRTEHNLQ